MPGTFTVTLFTPCCILYCTVWKQIPKHSPCWKDELFSLRGEYLHWLFRILLCGKFVSCLPFKMYSVIYTSMSMWIFILWWLLTHYYIFCFVAQTFQLQQLETLLIGSCVPLTYPLILFSGPFLSLTPQDALGLSCIFSTPTLEAAFFPKSPVSFCWKILIETKWALGELLFKLMICSTANSQWQNKDHNSGFLTLHSDTVPVWTPSVHTCGQRNYLIDTWT